MKLRKGRTDWVGRKIKPAEWVGDKVPEFGKLIYGLLIWFCIAPSITLSYVLAFAAYQKGAGAEYNTFLKDFYYFLFTLNSKWEFPDIMNVVNAIKELADASSILEKLAEFGKFNELGSLFEDATHLTSLSLACSLVRTLALAFNQVVDWASGNFGLETSHIGSVLQSADEDAIFQITNPESAKEVVANDYDSFLLLSPAMQSDPDVVAVFKDLFLCHGHTSIQKYVGTKSVSVVAAVAEALKSPECKVWKVSFQNWEWYHGTQAACSIIEALEAGNQSLKEVFFYNVPFGGSGDGTAFVERLAEVLKKPDCKIQDLSLDACSMDRLVYKIAEALPANTSLKRLSLQNNDISPADIDKIVDAWNLGRQEGTLLIDQDCAALPISLARPHLNPAIFGT